MRVAQPTRSSACSTAREISWDVLSHDFCRDVAIRTWLSGCSRLTRRRVGAQAVLEAGWVRCEPRGSVRDSSIFRTLPTARPSLLAPDASLTGRGRRRAPRVPAAMS
eukprot:scaffold1827_cov421-Prasinococcus_capsulatus_cf.AAC.41